MVVWEEDLLGGGLVGARLVSGIKGSRLGTSVSARLADGEGDGCGEGKLPMQGGGVLDRLLLLGSEEKTPMVQYLVLGKYQ